MEANYLYTYDTPKKGDLCLLIWKCDDILLGNIRYNSEHIPILVPMQIVDIDEQDNISLRPRICINNQWMIFSLGIEEETGNPITTLLCTPGDGTFERLIHYDWYSKSGAQWTNKLYSPNKTLAQEIEEVDKEKLNMG